MKKIIVIASSILILPIILLASLIFCLLVLFLIILYLYHINSNFYHKFDPDINKNNKNYITVEGHIDDGLKKRDFEIISVYKTTNPECDYGSQLEVGDLPRYRVVEYPLKTDNFGNYKILIPLDYYKMGKCGWLLNDIEISNNSEDMSQALSYFMLPTTVPRNFKFLMSSNLLCSSKGICNYHDLDNFIGLIPVDKKFKFSLTDAGLLPVNYNYIYKLNLIEKNSDGIYY